MAKEVRAVRVLVAKARDRGVGEVAMCRPGRHSVRLSGGSILVPCGWLMVVLMRGGADWASSLLGRGKLVWVVKMVGGGVLVGWMVG